MVRTAIGGLVAGIAMFIVGFVLWQTPLSRIGYSRLDPAQGAATQLSLAQNVPHGGRYIVPSPASAEGAVLYGRGPVAVVDYNPNGFSRSDPASMIGGLIKDAAVGLMIAFSLFVIAHRVPDFTSRMRVVVGLSAAAGVLMLFSDPIFNHTDWRYAIFA